jgi:hypothetical protein
MMDWQTISRRYDPPIISKPAAMKTKRRSCLMSRLSCLLAVTSVTAVTSQAASTITEEDLLLARSPVVIKTRLNMGNEFTDVGGGGHRDKLVFGGTYGFGFDDQHRNFGIAFELPFLWNDPENGASDWGVGDFKLKGGQLFTWVPEGWRAGWFFETEFDTAADDVYAIANQRTQMAFGAGMSFPVLENLTVSTIAQYGWSLDEGTTTGRKSEWELHITPSWKVMDRVSLNLDYKAVINTVGGTELFNTLEPSVGFTLGENKEYGMFTSLEIPLDETGVNWVAKVGLIRFF